MLSSGIISGKFHQIFYFLKIFLENWKKLEIRSSVIVPGGNFLPRGAMNSVPWPQPAECPELGLNKERERHLGWNRRWSLVHFQFRKVFLPGQILPLERWWQKVMKKEFKMRRIITWWGLLRQESWLTRGNGGEKLYPLPSQSTNQSRWPSMKRYFFLPTSFTALTIPALSSFPPILREDKSNL